MKLKTKQWQLHTNDFTLYQQHIRHRGQTAPGFHCALLLCRLTGAGLRITYKRQFLKQPLIQLFFSQAGFGSDSKYHMFSYPSLTNEHLPMTSLPSLISCLCRVRSVVPRGSGSLPWAGSSLTDSFLFWWGHVDRDATMHWVFWHRCGVFQ